MGVSDNLRGLISIAEPLWAGESEVFRTYWESPMRTVETDLIWLGRQASKEFNGSGVAEYKNLGCFMGPLTELQEMFPKIDAGVSRHAAFERIEMIHEEFAHYMAFADAYDAIRPAGAAALNPHEIAPWDEDVALNAYRHQVMDEHGEIGVRATKLSEGGYCSLFREGMRLKGRGGADDVIAEACSKIYDDEFGHMLKGIIGLDDEKLADDDWRLMGELVAGILKRRILMRNAEFSYPLDEDRVHAIFDGDIDPIAFDYQRAEEALA